MKTMQVQWEDEENNRIIAMTVGYTITDEVVDVAVIAPQRVTFVCPDTGSPVRHVRVWTDAGRRHLARKFKESGRYEELCGRMLGEATA